MVAFRSEQDDFIFGGSTDMPYPALKGMTAEPFKNSLLDALQRYLPDAIDAADNNPDLSGPVGMVLPKGYSMATIANYSLQQSWPWISVISRALTPVQPGEQKQSGRWRLQVSVIAMLKEQSDSKLSILLDRYGDAIWRALMQADNFNGWQIDLSTVTILNSETPQTNVAMRGVGVFFEGYTYG